LRELVAEAIGAVAGNRQLGDFARSVSPVSEPLIRHEGRCSPPPPIWGALALYSSPDESGARRRRFR